MLAHGSRASRDRASHGLCPVAGSFLAVPTGIYNRSSSSAPGYTTYIYALGHWEAPVSMRILSQGCTTVPVLPLPDKIAAVLG